MNNNQKVRQTISQMIDLLQQYDQQSWADRLNTYRSKLEIAPLEAQTEILRMYGGMGSINDIVLHKNQAHLVAENQLFDHLREQLFMLLRSSR